MHRRIPQIALAGMLLAGLAGTVGLAGPAQASAAQASKTPIAVQRVSNSTTIKKVHPLIAGCNTASERDIGYGDTGDVVKRAQCELNNSIEPNYGGNLPPLLVDGQFGTNTENVVKEFQRCIDQHHGGNLTVDGRVGAHTWPLLDQWANSAYWAC